MGYNVSTWSFFSKYLDLDNCRGKRIMELGNQAIREPLREKLKIKHALSKPFFTERGYDHFSIDIIGGKDVLVKDLSSIIDDESLVNSFDVVTNNGTSEHVEPYLSQYQCFANIHNLVKKDGIMLHIVPEVGSYPNHCQIYYKKEFFRLLSSLNNYKILHLGRIKKAKDKNFVAAALKKTEDNVFVSPIANFFKYVKFVPFIKKKNIHKKRERDIAKARKLLKVLKNKI